jgi:hypothetical protein
MSWRKACAAILCAVLGSSALSQPEMNSAAPLSRGAGSMISARPGSLTIAYSRYLWPPVSGVATVYYMIDENSDPNATPNINSAIHIFNTDFPGVIQWVPWNSSLGANYVDINLSATDASGVCEANEGYEAIAEQSRSDRNTYISVNYSNVVKGSESNFWTIADDRQILGPHDYASVMQYIPYAFSRNGAR